MRDGCDDRGSLVLVIAATIVLVALMAFGVGELGTAAIDRSRAQNAADAAALAGVPGGRAASARLARSNGGTLVSFERRGWVVTVVVEVGGASARARATDGP